VNAELFRHNAIFLNLLIAPPFQELLTFFSPAPCTTQVSCALFEGQVFLLPLAKATANPLLVPCFIRQLFSLPRSSSLVPVHTSPFMQVGDQMFTALRSSPFPLSETSKAPSFFSPSRCCRPPLPLVLPSIPAFNSSASTSHPPSSETPSSASSLQPSCAFSQQWKAPVFFQGIACKSRARSLFPTTETVPAWLSPLLVPHCRKDQFRQCARIFFPPTPFLHRTSYPFF